MRFLEEKGRGTALILGGGDSLWDDYRELEELMGEPWPGVVLIVNAVGYQKGEHGKIWDGPVHHWCTLHAEKFQGWKKQRKARGLSMDFISWSSVRRTVMDVHFVGWTGGSSGFYAVSVALRALRHPRVVLCGIPMDSRKNAFSGREWTAYSRYLRGWQREEENLKGRVKSMSGWTQKTFGAPSLDWIGLVPKAKSLV